MLMVSRGKFWQSKSIKRAGQIFRGSFCGYGNVIHTRPSMNQKIDALINGMLSTEYPRWRNMLSSVMLTMLCTSIVGSFIYLYLTKPLLQCYEGFLLFSIVWLICEYIIIIYLYKYNSIPSFARTNIKMVICFSNVWFGLFVFSLRACTV